MGTLFRIVLLTAPVIALIFYYVMTRHHTQDIQMEKDDLVFEREWAEFSAEFSSDRQKHLERARRAEQKLSRIEREEEERREKERKLEQELDRELKEFEKRAR